MPGASRPLSSSWLTNAVPEVNAATAIDQRHALIGQEGRCVRLARVTTVDHDVDLLQRVGAGHRPVTAACEAGAGPHHRCEGVHLIDALLAEERER